VVESTEGEVESNASVGPATEAVAPKAWSSTGATPLQRARFARAVEWFWRGAALREALAAVPVASPESAEPFRRALLAAEAGQRLLEPSPPLAQGPADAIACEMYRQSIAWALLAARGKSDGLGGGAKTASCDLSVLLATADRELLANAARGQDRLDELERALIGRTFADFAELEPELQSDLGWRLRRFVESLLKALSDAQRRVDAFWFQRTVRMTILAVVVVSSVAGAWFLTDALERDFAEGKPWRASSFGHAACTSPAQDCGGSFFFHTSTEDRPWLEIDLEAEHSFSSVRVRNRTDCCRDRAVPLAVEVSSDGEAYREVARREDEFHTWTVKFEQVTARYVRVQALRRTILHLNSVAVLP
jgi:hypothetical protein